MDFFKNPRLYLDYASSTPIDDEMMATFPRLSAEVLMANPSALHKEGVAARATLRVARELVANTLSAQPDEIIFTSSATESDNLALQGAVRAFLEQGIDKKDIAVMTTDMEHSAVIETANALAKQCDVIILPTENGLLDPKSIVISDDMKAVIVSVIYVNNEIGVVQHIYDIAKRIRFLRKHHPDTTIIFHIDATQAPLHYGLNVQKLGVDMMTLGATKLYCPKGVGMLYVKRGTPIDSVLYGGGQEHGLRPGTEPVQLIHFFAQSLAYAQKNVPAYSEKISAIKKHFEDLIKKEISEAVITAEDLDRTPHISHIAIKDFDSELLVLELDARGIAVSAKSACKNDDTNESGIVERIYGKGWGAVRFSFGRNTTIDESTIAVSALKNILEKYRQ
jgi:cysteine desulfurase